MIKTKKTVILSILGSLTLGLILTKDLFRPFDKLWISSQSNQTSRYPAATNWDLIDVSLIEDYFNYPTFGKSIDYKIKTKFYTDKNEDYLKRNALETIQESFVRTFEHRDPSSKASKLFTKNLYSGFIDNFIKTISVTKIINGQFQFDFEFVPSFQQQITFENELSTNQLINISKKSNLLNYIEKEELDLSQKIVNISWPDSGDLYQYSGGNITLWFKFLDMVWRPSQPIPNPKKNAVKGHIRFRKYFKVNPNNGKNSFLKNHFFEFENYTFKKDKKNQTRFITVDIYKSFNLDEMTPQLDRMEIHFGKVLASNEIHDSIVENLISIDKPDINTGVFILRGHFISDLANQKKIQSQISVKKLIYNFKDKEFESDSKVVVTLTGNSMTPEEKGIYKNEIKDRLLRISANDLIQFLELERFYSFNEYEVNE